MVRLAVGMVLALALAGCGLSDAEREQATGNSAPAVAGAGDGTPPSVASPAPIVPGASPSPAPQPSRSPSPIPDTGDQGDTGEPVDLLPGSDSAGSDSAGRPSFDCTRASGPAELAICDSPTLSRLDRRLNRRYAEALAAAEGRDRARLVADQRAFLRARDACDVDSCIEEAYRRQLRSLDRPNRDSGGATPGRGRPNAGEAPDGRPTCEAEIGTVAADRLVRQCRNVSPATRPPCNVQNSCAMIRDEIQRGCAMLDPGDAPGYCDRYR